MNILLVNSYYEPEVIGGAEKSVKKLAEILTKQGHKVTILCTCEKGITHENIEGVHVIRFSPKNFGRRIDHVKLNFENCNLVKRMLYWELYKQNFVYFIDTYNVLNYNILQKFIREIKPDVIHTNGLYEITPVIWKVANRYKIRLIHTLRDYYLMCINGNLKKLNDKCECHEVSEWCERRRIFNFRLMEKYPDIFTCPSEATKAVFTDWHKELEPKIKVIYNAIDYDYNHIEQLKERKEKEILFKKKVKFVYVGAISEFKGILWLLNQFHELVHDDIELHIAGTGDLNQIVKKQCEIDKRIVFHGFMQEDDLNQLLEGCDLLVCPSLWAEPFGRVVLDAYKNMLPVITSGFGGLGEIVDHKKTGYILDMQNPHGLEEAVSYFLDDRKIFLTVYQRIIKKIKEFSIDNQAAAFLEVYSENPITTGAKNDY